MIESVKARYSRGVIVPMEALDIEEGADLSITIDVKPPLSGRGTHQAHEVGGRKLEGK